MAAYDMGPFPVFALGICLAKSPDKPEPAAGSSINESLDKADLMSPFG